MPATVATRFPTTASPFRPEAYVSAGKTQHLTIPGLSESPFHKMNRHHHNLHRRDRLGDFLDEIFPRQSRDDDDDDEDETSSQRGN